MASDGSVVERLTDDDKSRLLSKMDSDDIKVVAGSQLMPLSGFFSFLQMNDKPDGEGGFEVTIGPSKGSWEYDWEFDGRRVDYLKVRLGSKHASISGVGGHPAYRVGDTRISKVILSYEAI